MDDRPEALLAIGGILDELGQPVVTASSGEAALRALMAEDYAVIILDVRLPGMDGFETAVCIKGRERTRAIPIIFLTASADEPHQVRRSYEVGAVDYLCKPVEPNELRSKVAVFVAMHQQLTRVRMQVAAAEVEMRRVAHELAAAVQRMQHSSDVLPIPSPRHFR
ncbi:response regulator [Streptomyces boninensis]|uniref:response regulator n=1 Tax=Streptomyces boninensis TaxID=2039455 RepID=UPI003B2249BA